jgi:hypothetical protein
MSTSHLEGSVSSPASPCLMHRWIVEPWAADSSGRIRPVLAARHTRFPVTALMVLLLCAPPAAAEVACLGQWRLDLVTAVPASEGWLSEDSWCRSERLPRTIDVRVGRNAGEKPGHERLAISGTPYRPSDVLMVPGDRCELQFDGKASGLPAGYRLSLEVDPARLSAFGKGTCSQLDPMKADGSHTGLSIGLLVRATRLPGDAAPVAPPTPEHPTVAVGQGFRMIMPLPFQTSHEEAELPWGKAAEAIFLAADPFTNTTYLFGTHAWRKPPKKLEPAGLRKIRALFLKNRGCAAREIRGTNLEDAQGSVWPQTVFEGSCEGGDKFRAAFLLAGGSLYHFQAVHQMSLHRRATLALDQALARLVGSFAVVE